MAKKTGFSRSLLFIQLIFETNIGERKRPMLSIDLTVPLTCGVHGCHGNNITNLNGKINDSQSVNQLTGEHQCKQQKKCADNNLSSLYFSKLRNALVSNY